VTSLWFLVPAHGRVDLTRVCLRQLRRTCDALTEGGLYANAVVAADDANIDTAEELGFATVWRVNEPLGRKWNDCYQLACDPKLNPEPADYVAALGTDDWVDPEFILAGGMPDEKTMRCARLSAVVNEDCTRLANLNITYAGGDGVRIIPAAMLEPLRWRPAEEDYNRAMDTSVITRIGRDLGRAPQVEYFDLHPLQIVDFKSSTQLNPYEDCLTYLNGVESTDPFGDLAAVYPAEAIDEMRALVDSRMAAAA
jgi:hypothetical protein